jgi:hypothetical protein
MLCGVVVGSGKESSRGGGEWDESTGSGGGFRAHCPCPDYTNVSSFRSQRFGDHRLLRYDLSEGGRVSDTV